MNTKQVHRFVHQYLEATQCSILEKSPAHFIVKLSPQADRMLTGRTYYWSFVDRTGAEPETMTYLFVTDKEKYDKANEQPESSGAGKQDTAADRTTAAATAALGRSFGFIHSGALATGRLPREDLYFGSRRLEQLFEASRSEGSYVYLFEQPDNRTSTPFDSIAYTPWLSVNVKVEFQCDRKREEIHSFGVSLATGLCVEQFHDRLNAMKMTPKLPPNIHIARSGITLNKAVNIVEAALERKLKTYDYEWAKDAGARLEEEQTLISHYYERLLESADEERKEAIREQYENRKAEIDWQYRPRVTASAINCGIFHLAGID
ncbi:YqhG family protein [Paenibacillus tarimensis]